MRGPPDTAIVVAMTETTYGPPLPPPAPPPARLERDPDDKVIAGVCAAFARYTDTDPVLWRVTIAVLTLFGGAGLVLYVLAWALVPRSDRGSSFVERTLRGGDHGISAAGVVLLVIGGVVLLGILADGPGLGALLVVGAVAYLVARERREPRRPSEVGPYAGEHDAQHGPASGPAYGPVPPPLDDPTSVAWTPTPRRARRPRSPLGALTVSLATLLTGVLLALRLSGVESVTAPRILAVSLLVVGAGLLLGAWVGRARWLIAVGLVLALALGGSVAARNAGLDDGLGERTWTPTGDASYALGAGETVLDLSSLRPGSRSEVEVELGVGRLLVRVPRDVRVTGEAQAGVGELLQVDDGRRRVLNPDDDTDVRERVFFPGEAGGPEVELDLEVGMGQIEVRRVA
jgi:phage shock protein PspC (stress-responsive transcriptional regulator)